MVEKDFRHRERLPLSLISQLVWYYEVCSNTSERPDECRYSRSITAKERILST